MANDPRLVKVDELNRPALKCTSSQGRKAHLQAKTSSATFSYNRVHDILPNLSIGAKSMAYELPFSLILTDRLDWVNLRGSAKAIAILTIHLSLPALNI